MCVDCDRGGNDKAAFGSMGTGIAGQPERTPKEIEEEYRRLQAEYDKYGTWTGD